MNHFFKFLSLFWVAALLSCQTTGPVRSSAKLEHKSAIEPKEFISPLTELKKIELQRKIALERLPTKPKFKSDSWVNFMEISQVYETMEAQQEEVETELEQTGELILEPGRSYSFSLESFCVEPGVTAPSPGDGLSLAPLDGPGKDWISDILKKQGKIKLPQDRVQTLIWALLSDVRFDELDDVNQQSLMQYYSNAQIRFGNRTLEQLGTGFLQNLLPNPVQRPLNKFEKYKNRILTSQEDYEQLAHLLVPQSTRKTSLPIGWLKADDGYFIKLIADGYSQVHIDIFVPQHPEKKVSGRSIAALKNILFQPWKWLALPKSGQKLAMSTKSNRKKKKAPKAPCEHLKEWKPKQCKEITAEDRKRILELADPKNFPKTRYQMPPKRGTPIEEETDCSHFTNEIYRRAGIEFEYASTGYLTCINYLKEIPSEQAIPGDLLLFKGHVGIMDSEGNLVSATVGSDRSSGVRIERSKLPSDDIDFKPSISKIKRSKNSFEYPGFGAPKVIRWSCP